MNAQQPPIIDNAITGVERMPNIDALTQRAHELGQKVDWWNGAMLTTLVIAAIAATLVVITTYKVVVRAGQLAGVQEQIIALVNQKAGDANERAAKLELQAEELREQLAAQERRGTVLMNPEIRKRFLSHVREFSGQHFDVVSCGLKESEIAYFSMSVWSTLSGAGWNIGKIETDSPSCSAGMSILINDSAPKPTRDAAQGLLSAFVEVGLIPTGSGLGNIPKPPPNADMPGVWYLHSSRVDSVLVLVGTHP